MIRNNNSIFNEPVYVAEPYSWLEFTPFANFIVDVLKPKLLVELGTQNGNAYFSFCRAVATTNIDTSCYAIGPWANKELFEKVLKFNNQHFGNFSKLLPSNSGDALSQFEDGSIDLLHIDGLQNYDVLKHIFDTWKPKLTNTAVMIVQNTMIKERNPGARKIFEELQHIYPSFQLMHGPGLGIICTGNNINKGFLSFMEEANESNFYQSLFSTLGNRLLLKQLLNKKNELSKTLEANTQSLMRENKRLKAEVNAKKEALYLQKKSTRQKEKRISALIKEVNELMQEINNKKEQLAASEFQIKKLTGIIANAKKSVSWKITAPLRYFNRNLSYFLQYLIVISKSIWHFISFQNAKANEGLQLLKNAILIKRSGLLNKEYYLGTYPEVGHKNQQVILHYLLHGAKERRNPGEIFFTDVYLKNYPDVQQTGINPLVHYIKHGISESRNAQSLMNISKDSAIEKAKPKVKEQLNLIHCGKDIKCLKLYPKQDVFTNHNYAINFGVWDFIDADKVLLEESYDLNFDKFDFVFLPMRKRWGEHKELLNLIKASKAKAILFDNDSCYYHFTDEFYAGLDFIYYRIGDHAGNVPEKGKYLPWSIDTSRYTPKYGGKGILFSSNTMEWAYPLRHQIKNTIQGLSFRVEHGEKYIENLQNSAAAIHTDSLIAPVARGKLVEFASCGTQIISNRTEYMDRYYSDDLIIYFDSVDQLQTIIDQFQPNIEIQKELRRQTELKHDDRIRAMEIIQDLKQL